MRTTGVRDDYGSAPVVSVCVPTFEGATYLTECLESVRQQTLRDFECIIVDDGSSDPTVSIALNFAANDKRFHVVENETRLGLAANWNRAIELSRGRWVKLLFQDDLLERTCLQQLVSACEEAGGLFGFCRRKVLVESDVAPDWREGVARQAKLLDQIYRDRRTLSADRFTEVFTKNSNANLIGEPTVTIFARDAIRRVGTFETGLIQLADTEYWTRLGTNYGVVHVPHELAAFRLHTAATTSRNLQHRTYRMFVLDPLVQRYLFLCKPAYRNLRQALRHRGSELANWSAFIRSTHHARQMVRSNASGAGIERERMLEEWRTVAERFPLLRLLGWASDAAIAMKTLMKRFFAVRSATRLAMSKLPLA